MINCSTTLPTSKMNRPTLKALFEAKYQHIKKPLWHKWSSNDEKELERLKAGDIVLEQETGIYANAL